MKYMRDVRSLTVGQVEELVNLLAQWVDAEECRRNPTPLALFRGGKRAARKREEAATETLEALRERATALFLVEVV